MENTEINTKEIEDLYASYPTEKLLEIIDDKFSYTDVAVVAALQELNKRNITPGDIEMYKAEQVEKLKQGVYKDFFYELSLLQKHLFYFLFFLSFITFGIRRNFIEDGYYLKLKQSRFFSWAGIAFLCVALYLQISFSLTDYSFWAIWIAGFIITLLLDKLLNKKVGSPQIMEENTDPDHS